MGRTEPIQFFWAVSTGPRDLAAMYPATVYPIYVVVVRDGFIAGTQRGDGGEEALRRLIVRAGIESGEDSDSDSISW